MATISGKITDAAGSPIPSVTVELLSIRGKEVDVIAATQTNATGDYAFTDPPSGRYRIKPKSNTDFFDPEDLPAKFTGTNIANKDFEAIATTGYPPPKDKKKDRQAVEDALAACLSSLPGWFDKYEVDEIRQRVRNFIVSFLYRPGDASYTAFDSLAIPEGLSMEEKEKLIYSIVQQEHDALEQRASEMIEKLRADDSEELLGNVRIRVLCSVCQNRYYTPGTAYYMNYPALVNCMNYPPCT